jgi:hypothetical protein
VGSPPEECLTAGLTAGLTADDELVKDNALKDEGR